MANDISARKKIGYALTIALSAVLMIFAFCGRFFNSGLKVVANFFVGSFGMAFYGLMIATIVICSFALAGKHSKVPAKYVVHFVLMFVEIVLLTHMYSTQFLLYSGEDSTQMISYAEYVNYVYNYYSIVPTFGGVVFGSIVYGLQKVITIYATSVLLFGMLAWSVIMTGDFFYSYFTGKLSLIDKPKASSVSPVAPEVAQPVREDPIANERASAYDILFPEQNRDYNNYDRDIFGVAPQSKLDDRPAQTSTKEQAADILGIPNVRPVAEPETPEDDEMGAGNGFFDHPDKLFDKSSPLPWQTERTNDSKQNDDKSSDPSFEESAKSTNVSKTKTRTVITETEDEDGGKWLTSEIIPEEPTNDIEVDAADIYTESDHDDVPAETEAYVQTEDHAEEELAFNEPEAIVPEETAEAVREKTDNIVEVAQEPEQDDGSQLIAIEKLKEVPGGIQMGYDFHTKAEVEKAQKKIHKYPKYIVPPFDILEEAVAVEDTEQAFREKAAEAIVQKLAVFGIKIQSEYYVVGPSVTRYAFRVLSERTKMSDFNRYSMDIKACLEASNDIIIQAPIPGTNLIGIEVANKTIRTVKLRNLLESKEFRESKAKLAIVIGQEISGKIIIADLAKMPHLLVAGTTGSGKSVFMHSMIISLMYKYGPEYLRFIMVDPKQVEFKRYEGVPHMLTSEPINKTEDALASMDYLINEMESRYSLFKQSDVVDIGEYNLQVNPKIQQRLPYLVLIVDELSDLMASARKQFEAKILKLAQKSRAAGIHMVLATQRPDVSIITGTIKTNFSCRVALKVAQPQDSVTIISTGGAEKLLGKGDMLYLGEGQATPTRVQGTYVSNDEGKALVAFIKENNEQYFDENIAKSIFASEQQPAEEPKELNSSNGEKLDPLCKEALRFWLEHKGGKASIASIQRTLGIGFNRAGRIMASLQKLKYVEEIPDNEPSTRAVKVLVTLEQLDELFPDMKG